MIKFGQNQNLASSKAFYGYEQDRQTSHDACLDGTLKQFAVIEAKHRNTSSRRYGIQPIVQIKSSCIDSYRLLNARYRNLTRSN